MRKKIAVVIGGTGEIGGAFVKRLLKRGYAVYVPARDLSKPSVKELMMLPDVFVSLCKVEDKDDFQRYVQSLFNDGVIVDLFVLAVGVWKRDNQYADVQEALKELRKANVVTKENAYAAIDAIFSAEQKKMRVVVVSSHARWFKPGDKYYGEQIAYVTISDEVSVSAEEKADRFEKLLVMEPGPINTKGYRDELGLTEEEAKKVPGILSPDEFVEQSLEKLEQEKVAA